MLVTLHSMLNFKKRKLRMKFRMDVMLTEITRHLHIFVLHKLSSH